MLPRQSNQNKKMDQRIEVIIVARNEGQSKMEEEFDKKSWNENEEKHSKSSSTFKKLLFGIIACIATVCIGINYFSHFMDYEQVNAIMAKANYDHNGNGRKLKICCEMDEESDDLPGIMEQKR